MITMAKEENQKLKMLYLVKFFSEETDDEHALTTQEIISLLRNPYHCFSNLDSRRTDYENASRNHSDREV